MDLLLGIGDEDDVAAALEAAVARAREAGDDLTVAVYADEESVEAVERRVRDRLDALDFSATVRPIEGDPGGTLVELAATEGYDRIVLYSGQRSPLGKVRLGDVAEFVLLNAQTTVTLLR